MGPGESSMADEGEEVTKAGNEAVLNVRSSDVVLTSSASIPSFRITDHVRGGIVFMAYLRSALAFFRIFDPTSSF